MKVWLRFAMATTLALVAVAATAAPAAAHATAGQAPTDWESRVVATGDPRVHAAVVDLGQHIEVATDGPTIVVLGYSNEPYLRIGHTGVFENVHSPAALLNRSATLPSRLPRAYNASAPPEWVLRSHASSWRWHDHRVHHMAGGDARQWAIPLRIEGRLVEIRGVLQRSTPAFPWVAVAAALLAALAVVSVARAGTRTVAVVIAIFGLLAAVQLVGALRFGTASLTSRVGPSAYGASAAAVALLVAWLSARQSSAARIAPAWLLSGLLLAIGSGLANSTWLAHSELPTTLGHGLAQGIVGCMIGGGVALVVLGARRLRIAAGTVVVEPRA